MIDACMLGGINGAACCEGVPKTCICVWVDPMFGVFIWICGCFPQTKLSRRAAWHSFVLDFNLTHWEARQTGLLGGCHLYLQLLFRYEFRKFCSSIQYCFWNNNNNFYRIPHQQIWHHDRRRRRRCQAITKIPTKPKRGRRTQRGGVAIARGFAEIRGSGQEVRSSIAAAEWGLRKLVVELGHRHGAVQRVH